MEDVEPGASVKNSILRDFSENEKRRVARFNEFSSREFSKIFGNVYWEMPDRSFTDQENVLQFRNQLLERERKIELKHNDKMKEKVHKAKLKEMTHLQKVQNDQRIRRIVHFNLKSLQSQVLKNLLKSYSVKTEMRKRRLLKLKNKEKKLKEKKEELGRVFSNELVRILESAQAKESLYRESNPIRPKLNKMARREDRKKVFQWLQMQREQNIFGVQEVFKLKAFLLKHEKVFGEEFEERFDLYKIILALAKL